MMYRTLASFLLDETKLFTFSFKAFKPKKWKAVQWPTDPLFYKLLLTFFAIV